MGNPNLLVERVPTWRFAPCVSRREFRIFGPEPHILRSQSVIGFDGLMERYCSEMPKEKRCLHEDTDGRSVEPDL